MTDKREMRVASFRIMNQSESINPTVFLGDSITQQFQLKQFFHDKNVCNRGIGGDTTADVLKRLDVSAIDLNPSQIFLLIGTNDLEFTFLSPKEISQNIQTIAEHILKQCPGTKIHFVSVLPVGDPTDYNFDPQIVGKRNNDVIDNLNIYIKEVAENLHQTYLDINSVLKNPSGTIYPQFTKEGLHISYEGYQIIAEIYRKYL